MLTLFWIASSVTLLGAVVALTRRNGVHALLWAVTSLLGVATVFASLGAPLMAALEVIVYAGAILVLFVFVVMLLADGSDDTLGSTRTWLGPTALALLLAVALFASHGVPVGTAERVPPRAVALSLLGPYVIGVELVSLLLLAALVGAWQIGRDEEPVDRPEDVANTPRGGRS